jgi:hypothetical protein
MPGWLIAICVIVAILLALVVYVWIGLRRIDALHRLYADRPTLVGALDTAGGARRGPTGDLTLARQVSVALNMASAFDRQVIALSEAEAAGAKSSFLEDAALFFHATLSDLEMKRFISDPGRLKRSHVREGVSHLIVWSAAKCVGEARKQSRSEGL